jgi:hypothetical protein
MKLTTDILDIHVSEEYLKDMIIVMLFPLKNARESCKAIEVRTEETIYLSKN